MLQRTFQQQTKKYPLQVGPAPVNGYGTITNGGPVGIGRPPVNSPGFGNVAGGGPVGLYGQQQPTGGLSTLAQYRNQQQQQNSPWSYAQGLLDQYQQAQDSARAANEQRYDDGLLGYLQLRDRNMERITSLGDQQRADTNQRYDDQLSTLQADLASRGLGGSSLRISNATVNERERGDALRRIEDDIVNRQIAADQGLTSQALQFMERRNDTGPDMNQLAQIMQLIGSGNFGQGFYGDQSGGAGGNGNGGNGGGGSQQTAPTPQTPGSNKRLMNGLPTGQTGSRNTSRFRSGVDPGTVAVMARQRQDQIARGVDRNMRVGGQTPGAAIQIQGLPINGPQYGVPSYGPVSNYGGYPPAAHQRPPMRSQPQRPQMQRAAPSTAPLQQAAANPVPNWWSPFDEGPQPQQQPASPVLTQLSKYFLSMFS